MSRRIPGKDNRIWCQQQMRGDEMRCFFLANLAPSLKDYVRHELLMVYHKFKFMEVDWLESIPELLWLNKF